MGLFDTLQSSVGSGQNSAIGNTLLSLLASEVGAQVPPTMRWVLNRQPRFPAD